MSFPMIGLGIAVIIINGLLDALPGYATDQTYRQFSILLGTFYSVTAITSLWATLTIAYRIHSSTRNFNKRKHAYTYIIDIIIQSASVYSALMLAQAICFFASHGKDTNPTLDLASEYLTALGVVSSVS